MSGKSISRYIIFSKSPYFIGIHCQQPLHKAFRYMISSKFQIVIYLVIYFRLPGNKKWPPRFRIFIRCTMATVSISYILTSMNQLAHGFIKTVVVQTGKRLSRFPAV